MLDRVRLFIAPYIACTVLSTGINFPTLSTISKSNDDLRVAMQLLGVPLHLYFTLAAFRSALPQPGSMRNRLTDF